MKQPQRPEHGNGDGDGDGEGPGGAALVPLRQVRGLCPPAALAPAERSQQVPVLRSSENVAQPVVLLHAAQQSAAALQFFTDPSAWPLVRQHCLDGVLEQLGGCRAADSPLPSKRWPLLQLQVLKLSGTGWRRSKTSLVYVSFSSVSSAVMLALRSRTSAGSLSRSKRHGLSIVQMKQPLASSCNSPVAGRHVLLPWMLRPRPVSGSGGYRKTSLF